MRWIHSHPFISALCVACLAIVVSIFASANPMILSQKTVAWTSNGGVWSPIEYELIEGSQTGVQSIFIQPTQTVLPYTIPPNAVVNTKEGAFDINDFFPTLTQKPTTPTNAPSNDPSIVDPYEFVPKGLIHIPQQLPRTKVQEDIYDYGNAVGSYIQDYERQYPDAVSILKAQAEDMPNRTKGEAVQKLARALGSVGESMRAMKAVPSEIDSTHEAFAKSYIEIGAKLALVPKAQIDADLLRAVNFYNASVDTFIKNYLAMMAVFVAYEVAFGPGDAGSVFTLAGGSF